MRYFAYGSNMSSVRLLARVPSASVVGVATLHGHELRFHKAGRDHSAKCDAFEVADGHGEVIGVLYDIDPEQRVLLDSFEGLGCGYEIKTVYVVMKGQSYEAFTYYATHIDNHQKPFDWYLLHVLAGAREHGLPQQYIDDIRAVPAMKDDDVNRRRNEMRIYTKNINEITRL